MISEKGPAANPHCMEATLEPVLSKDGALGEHALEDVQEAHWVMASQRGDAVAFNRLVLKWEKSIYNLN